MAVISLHVLLLEGSIRRLNGWGVDHQKLGGLITQHDDLVLFTGWKIYGVTRFQLLFLTTHFHFDSAFQQIYHLLLYSVFPLEFLSLKIPHDRIVIQMISHRAPNGIQFR